MSGATGERVARLYRESTVWDAHAGFEPTPDVDLNGMAAWRAAGVDFLSINVGYDVMPWTDTVKALARIKRFVDATEGFQRVSSVADIAAAKAAGQLAVAFDIEGMCALDDCVDMVALYHDLGVRQMVFAYNLNNAAGGGCHDEDIGLTEFGREVVREMNRVGMLVDCSHTGYRTSMEAMEWSTAPVIFSHSNSRRLRDHERNIRDDQALACARTGGVVGVNGISCFLGEDDIRVERMADHVLHWVELIGAEHVGIGLDWFFDTGPDSGIDHTVARNPRFWPPAQYPPGRVRCIAPESLPALAEALLDRGLDEAAVSGVLGGNFMRVAGKVWR